MREASHPSPKSRALPKIQPIQWIPQKTDGYMSLSDFPDTLKVICVEYKQQQHGEGNRKPQQMNCFYAFAHALPLFNIFKLSHSPSQWNDWLKMPDYFSIICFANCLCYFISKLWKHNLIFQPTGKSSWAEVFQSCHFSLWWRCQTVQMRELPCQASVGEGAGCDCTGLCQQGRDELRTPNCCLLLLT